MTSDLPLVSVIIPTRNRGEQLLQALRSVLAQSYAALEIIVVDDASSEDMRVVVATLDDPRIRLLRHAERRGGGAARNTGIRAASGDWIAFLDDDDEWLPDKLARQMERVRIAPGGEVPVVYTGEQYVDAAGDVLRILRPRKQGWILKDLLFGNYVGSTSTVLAARSALLAVDGFDENQRSCQDWDLWIRMAERCPFYAAAEPLVIRHVYGQRIDSDLAAQMQGRLQLLAKIEPHLVTLPRQERRRVLANHYLMLGAQCLALGAPQQGREYALRSLRENAGNVRSWRLLIKATIRTL